MEGVSHCTYWSRWREVHGGSKREGWSLGSRDKGGSGFKGSGEKRQPSEHKSEVLKHCRGLRSETPRVSQFCHQKRLETDMRAQVSSMGVSMYRSRAEGLGRLWRAAGGMCRL